MRKRHTVLVLLCVMSAITFLDRLAMPVAEAGVRADLHLDARHWGWVLSAYVLANALFEIPSGIFGDRRGQRLELTRIAVWWSGFTAITGLCRDAWQAIGARFLFGMGAAGAYPNAAGVISRWFPKSEHAQAQGFVWAASRLGGALAPLLLAPMARAFGWRTIFYVLGITGLLWAVIWWSFFRDSPEEMDGVSLSELLEIGGGEMGERSGSPWSHLVGLPQLWLITVAYFCYAWGSWFYYGWFTTWLVHGAGFTPRQMGLFASFPFLMGLAGNLVGGVLSEMLVRRYGRRFAYRLVCGSALTVTAGILVAMSLVHRHTEIVILSTLGFGVMDLMLPSAWAMCMSVGGQFGGTATAVMNTAGNLGGWLCTIVFGYVLQATSDYNVPVRIIAVMVLIAAALFVTVDCTRGLGDDLRLSRSV